MSKSLVFCNDKKIILLEIKKLLSDFIGNVVTFNQFIYIMNKDNMLQFYNRNTLLHRRNKFFRGGKKRSRKSSKTIFMPLGRFVKFLDFLDSDGLIDLVKFKDTIIYLIKIGDTL